jgi:hypothetical protein
MAMARQVAVDLAQASAAQGHQSPLIPTGTFLTLPAPSAPPPPPPAGRLTLANPSIPGFAQLVISGGQTGVNGDTSVYLPMMSMTAPPGPFDPMAGGTVSVVLTITPGQIYVVDFGLEQVVGKPSIIVAQFSGGSGPMMNKFTQSCALFGTGGYCPSEAIVAEYPMDNGHLVIPFTAQPNMAYAVVALRGSLDEYQSGFTANTFYYAEVSQMTPPQ